MVGDGVELAVEDGGMVVVLEFDAVVVDGVGLAVDDGDMVVELVVDDAPFCCCGQLPQDN